MNVPFYSYLIVLKKNRALLFSVITGTLISLVSNYFLVTSMGAVGAAVTELLTEVAVMVCYVAFSIWAPPLNENFQN